MLVVLEVRAVLVMLGTRAVLVRLLVRTMAQTEVLQETMLPNPPNPPSPKALRLRPPLEALVLLEVLVLLEPNLSPSVRLFSTLFSNQQSR